MADTEVAHLPDQVQEGCNLEVTPKYGWNGGTCSGTCAQDLHISPSPTHSPLYISGVTEVSECPLAIFVCRRLQRQRLLRHQANGSATDWFPAKFRFITFPLFLFNDKYLHFFGGHLVEWNINIKTKGLFSLYQPLYQPGQSPYQPGQSPYQPGYISPVDLLSEGWKMTLSRAKMSYHVISVYTDNLRSC